MENIKKFQELLRELFQFDCADLDFGIYRIMNYKRDVIEKFILEKLPEAVSHELEQGALAGQSQAAKELEAAIKKVLDALGDDALDASGVLNAQYHATKAGSAYLAALEKAKSAKGREALEAAIYNHLYSFFNRYYQDGDFISKRRYSKRERYAIPYNGEEVMLYWANSDQYYIKTGEYFTDYAWKATGGVTVRFKLVAADVEQNNVKGDKRFFLPKLSEIAWDESARSLTIPFEFRPLNGQEAITYAGKNQQETIIAKAVENIPKQRPVKSAPLALAALDAEKRRNNEGESVTALTHHLRYYIRGNTSDFFIHKDLKGFLARELDFYLKNEVLNLDEMEMAGAGLSEGWFQMLRLIKKVGGHVIEFLAQIEEFQKMLWEKRKFVTETFYCITMNSIPAELYPEIAACDAQWEEWKTLLCIDEQDASLFTTGKGKKDRRLEFLKTHPTLVLDTRHFTPAFTDRLLANFDDLDEATDGLLVNSENWQALNLLTGQYREHAQCIYIDPPYNTGSDGFIYRDNYQYASWITMLTERMRLAKIIGKQNCAFLAPIDDTSIDLLRNIYHGIYGRNGFLGNFVWRRRITSSMAQSWISTDHEYVLAFSTCPEQVEIAGIERDQSKYNIPDGKGGFYASMPLTVGMNKTQRPNQWYELKNPKTGTGYWPPPNRIWGFYPPTMAQKIDEDRIIWPEDYPDRNIKTPRYKAYSEDAKRDRKPVSTWIAEKGSSVKREEVEDNGYIMETGKNEEGTRVLKSFFGEIPVIFPKPVSLLTGLFQQFVSETGFVLDFFAGSGTSGHATINLNREDGGRRKFILVEMAHYFDTVLLPRIKKVTFSPEWKDGKPKRMATAEEAERSPRIVKVLRLESYEDALNNIAFDDPSGQQAMQFEDYLLQYMLKWETRHSETLLDVEKLDKPFSYQLHIHRDGETRTQAVDLPETFNYLLGLNIRKRFVVNDGDRPYLVCKGDTREGRKVAVIWRENEGWKEKDYARDKAFVAKQQLTEGVDDVYVNGDSYIPGARALEPLFRARMFADVEA